MVDEAPKGSNAARSMSDEATRVDSSPYVEPGDVELIEPDEVSEVVAQASDADERTLEESLNSPVSLPREDSIDDETKVQEVRFDDDSPLAGGAIPSGDDFSDSILDDDEDSAVAAPDTTIGFDDPDTGPYVIPDTVVHRDTDREDPQATEVGPPRTRAASEDDDPATVETSRPPSQIDDAPLREDTSDTSEDGLYERIERGFAPGARRIVERVSQEPGPAEKPWNQASVRPQQAPKESLLEGLAALPRVAKIGLVLLPLFLAGLLWGLLSSSGPDVESLPIEPESAAAKTAPTVAPEPEHGEEAPDEEVIDAKQDEVPTQQEAPKAADEPETEERPEAEPVPPMVEAYKIEPAPEGSAYVVAETKILSQPGDLDRPIALVSTGALVRVYDIVDGWALVRATGTNTAGYVPKKRLTSEKPVAVIAEELRFQQCRADDESFVESCLDSAERQLKACVLRCQGHARCEKACQVALAVCAKSCRGTPVEPEPTPEAPQDPPE